MYPPRLSPHAPLSYRSRAIDVASVVAGSGSYLPEKVLSNDDLAKLVDTNDAWIRKRTGIARRHIAADDQMTSDLAIAAARRALESAGMTAAELDLVICATATPDETFPATATRVQAALGMERGAAFDVQAVCSGFVYALSVADAMLKSGQARCALVIGAEIFSRILDWEDRGTCVLFGDGAGAIVLRGEAAAEGDAPRGILASHIFSDGRHHDALYVDGGPASTQTAGHLRMDGREVFRHAVVRMAEAMEAALDTAGLTAENVDWMVPHQANLRIIEALAKRLDFPMERVVVTLQDHANTSAASIPLALDSAVRDGCIKQNDVVLMPAMGGGFTWGAALLRW